MEALFPSDYTFVMSNEVETFAEPSCSKDDIIDALNNSLTIIQSQGDEAIPEKHPPSKLKFVHEILEALGVTPLN